MYSVPTLASPRPNIVVEYAKVGPWPSARAEFALKQISDVTTIANCQRRFRYHPLLLTRSKQEK